MCCLSTARRIAPYASHHTLSQYQGSVPHIAQCISELHIASRALSQYRTSNSKSIAPIISRSTTLCQAKAMTAPPYTVSQYRASHSTIRCQCLSTAHRIGANLP
eukprot:1987685-Rhodomonas_salina.2